MMISFLYRVKGSADRFYGKYIGKCPLYEEGLDRALASLLFPFLSSAHPALVDESDLWVGVLSTDREMKDYYSEEEKGVFDLLFCQWSPTQVEVFLQGVPLDKGK